MPLYKNICAFFDPKTRNILTGYFKPPRVTEKFPSSYRCGTFVHTAGTFDNDNLNEIRFDSSNLSLSSSVRPIFTS